MDDPYYKLLQTTSTTFNDTSLTSNFGILHSLIDVHVFQFCLISESILALMIKHTSYIQQ